MFPAMLDGAKVLFYSPKNDYGAIRYTTGELYDIVSYYAVCKYEHDTSFYLFGCNTMFEVISDSPWNSAEACMQVAQASSNQEITWMTAN